jgi:hypothetical protein
MRFRTGLIIGLAVGYYFGTKAGRERYEQIHDALSGFLDGDAVMTLRDRASDTLDRLRGLEPEVEVDLVVYEEPLEP